MRRTWLTTVLVLALGGGVTQGARAAGGPVAPVQGTYIGVPGSPWRYATANSVKDTVLYAREAGVANPVSELRVSGQYGIPAVNYSGQTTGLSGNGRTLVLADIPTTTPRTTRLIVLRTPALTIRARITLPGWSNVDAISPDGHWLYLIHYTSAAGTGYELQAYDLVTRRFLAKPLVDPREHGEKMIGIPITRVMSAGGRWAYTLYFRPSGVPFLHALDTVGRRTVCLDLPSLGNVDMTNAVLGLGPEGSSLRVSTDGVTRAVIDTRTFVVKTGTGRGGAAPARAVGHRRPLARAAGVPWEIIVLVLVVLGGLGIARAVMTRSRRRAKRLAVTAGSAHG